MKLLNKIVKAIKNPKLAYSYTKKRIASAHSLFLRVCKSVVAVLRKIRKSISKRTKKLSKLGVKGIYRQCILKRNNMINRYYVTRYKNRFEKEFFSNLIEMMSVKKKSIHLFMKSYISFVPRKIKVIENRENTQDVIIICAVKNDLDKVRMQIDYHKKLGLNFFVYIDNVSTDGTFEFLQNHPDVDLYTVKQKYTSTSKCAWQKSIMDIYGYDRWYLIIDSDELFMFPGIEQCGVNRYLKCLSSKNITTVKSPMIDMYTKGAIHSESSENNLWDEFSYFDVDTYYFEKKKGFESCRGGPRHRLFTSLGVRNETSEDLSKHALFIADKNTIFSSHHVFPKSRNSESGVIAFLLHYKFTAKDKDKHAQIIKDRNYANGSRLYKEYVSEYEKNSELTFFYEGSKKLYSSMDLLSINIIDNEFFDEFLTTSPECFFT